MTLYEGNPLELNITKWVKSKEKGEIGIFKDRTYKLSSRFNKREKVIIRCSQASHVLFLEYFK